MEKLLDHTLQRQLAEQNAKLAEQGAQVIVNDIDPLRGEQVAAAIRSAGGLASFFAADVTRSDQVAALVAAAVERHGRLDVMVNNAGWTNNALTWGKIQGAK
jgi:3-oxoacyl-[acyl-carrier protein] reductase